MQSPACLGRALAAQERFDEAIAPYRRASELWAGSADRKFALDNWGDALLGKKLYEDAAQKYREAIQVDPEYAVAYNDLGGALAAQERFDEAIEPYRRANKSCWRARSTENLCWTTGAKRCSEEGYEDAAQKYREAIQVDPEYADAYNDLGRAYAAQERFDEAIKQYKEAHALWEKANSPDRKIALWNWGGALLEQECFDDAVAKYADAVKAAPKDAMGFFFTATALLPAGGIAKPLRSSSTRRYSLLSTPITITTKHISCFDLASTRTGGRNGGPRGIALRACCAKNLAAGRIWITRSISRMFSGESFPNMKSLSGITEGNRGAERRCGRLDGASHSLPAMG